VTGQKTKTEAKSRWTFCVAPMMDGEIQFGNSSMVNRLR
jgi:hypothetical protein